MEFERPILYLGFHLVSSILSSFSRFGLKSAKICEHSTPFSQHPEMAEYIINRIPLPAEERMQDTLLLRRCISHPSKDASAIQAKMHQQFRIVRENTNSAQLGEKTSILRSRGASGKNIQIKSTFQKRESIPLTRVLMLMFSNFDNTVSQLFSHVACFKLF